MGAFVSKHLAKVLIGNGLLDLAHLVVPALHNGLRDLYKPLGSTGGPAFEELVRASAWTIAFHGAVRLWVGMNLGKPGAAEVAFISYVFESAPVLLALANGSPNVDIVGSLPFAVLPLIMLLILLRHRARSKKDKKSDE